MASKNDGDVPIGTVLAGKYRVERVLGQGGMGRVVEARHITLGERVALKFLLPEVAHETEAAARFLREAKASVRLRSEHVVRVSDVGVIEGWGTPYMVMEYLDGEDLGKLLKRTGPFGVYDSVDFVVQASEALAEAHSLGIIHRDVKPANLFLTRGLDGSPLVKVLDFGISKLVDPTGVDDLTRTSVAMGSALYMSPEQMRGARDVDLRTDIYALGVALYELLAGRQPYYADTLPQLCAEVLDGTPFPLREIRDDVPDELAKVIAGAYARKKDDRYPSIAHFVVALAPFAPPRSKNVVDRIARMAGLDPSRPPPLPTGAAPAGGVVAGPSIGATTGPVVGSNTTSGAVLTPATGTAPAPQRSRAPLFAVLGLATLGGVGLGTVYLSRSSQAAAPGAQQTASAASEPRAVTPAPPNTTAAPAQSPAATAVLTTSVAAVSVAAAPPQAATAAVPPRPQGQGPGVPAKPKTAAPVVTAAPPPADDPFARR